jgi:polyphosphate kinase
LLVLRDPDGVARSYVHIGTGNYNASTARVYTDLSLFTANPEITRAAHDVFSFLTAYAENPSYEPLLVAPLDLAEKCVALIDREADHARAGKNGRIIAKMNALLDKNIIQALYRASQAGVQIDLIVRGICALRPGVLGVSHNIRVRSIVGRFLEHSRIYYFANDGNEQTYMGSADWMPRNLYERVEVIVPLRDEMLASRVRHEILDAYLADNRKARVLLSDGTYIPAWQPQHGKRNRRPPTGTAAFSSQDFLMSVAEGKAPALMPAPPAPLRRRVGVGRER